MHLQEREKQLSQSHQDNEIQAEQVLDLKCKQKMISSKPTEKTSERTEYLYPPARINHASVVYKNKIYVWGGSILDPDSKSNPLYLYVYELDHKRWKRFWTKTGCKELDAFSGQCHAIINNRWYLFGGVNKDENYISQLWRLNLDSYEWIKCDQKNQSPFPSQGGCLVAFEKNWLLHYEGFNSKSTNNTHQIYIYSIDSKNWHRCEGNYELSLKFRIGTSMCVMNGRIFMFGGAYQTGETIQYLNDFYELKVHLPSKYAKAKVDVKVINRNSEVSPRIESFLFPIQKNYLCLLGGRNSQEQLSEMWIYNIKSNEWSKDFSFTSDLVCRHGVSCVLGGEGFFIFGGMTVQQIGNAKFMSDLWSLKVEWDILSKSDDDFENSETTFSHNCCLCYEKRNNFVFTSRPFSSQTIKDFKDSIEFPFAAFGLLFDNSLIHGANKISLQFQADSVDSTVIKIEDNGKNTWTEQEILHSLTTFCSQNNTILMGCDKKIKKGIHRSNSVKELGVNLKCGGLRLGKKVLYISLNADVLRVCLLSQENIKEENEEWQYVVRYYALNELDKELLDENMRSSQEYIDIQYKRYIRDALSTRTNKNIIYIFDTILDDSEEEIRCLPELNDVYFGNSDAIGELQSIGYNIRESIDISLRAYLSALYLKNEQVSITLGFKFSNPANINLQSSLDHIDKLCKSGASIELDGLVQFDFKFAQFYYIRQFKQNQKFFSNGVLLYYRNRLISRFHPNLGEIIPFLLTEHSYFSNFLPFFGFAELPQNIPLNAAKTAFTFTIMLEKMYSRLKFVEQSFKGRASHFLHPSQLPQPRAKPEYEYEGFIHKSKRSFTEYSEQRKPQKNLRKRMIEKSSEEPIIKKKSKRENQRQEFTPPNYKMREIEKQMRKAAETMKESQRQQSNQVLIEHIEESSNRDSSYKNDSN